MPSSRIPSSRIPSSKRRGRGKVYNCRITSSRRRREEGI